MSEIKTKVTGTAMSILLGKELNSKTAPELHEIIMDAVKDVNEINFDLKNLELLTSAGLREILTALQEMDEKGGKMTIKNASENIMGIFKMTGFLKILTIV